MFSVFWSFHQTTFSFFSPLYFAAYSSEVVWKQRFFKDFKPQTWRVQVYIYYVDINYFLVYVHIIYQLGKHTYVHMHKSEMFASYVGFLDF